MDRQPEIAGAGAREYGIRLLFRPRSEPEENLRVIADKGLEVQDFLIRLGVDEQARFVFNLAYEELSTNVARHVVPASERAVTVECGFAAAGGMVTFAFSDDGPAFHPFEPPNLDKAAADPSQGGMGLALLRRIFPGMEYARREGRNEIRVTVPCREG